MIYNKQKLYTNIISKIAKVVKLKINEGINFNDLDDSSDDDLNTIITDTFKEKYKYQSLKNILYYKVSKYKTFTEESKEREIEEINEVIEESEITINRKKIPTLLYHHNGLQYGQHNLNGIPGGFSLINFGRKNDRMAKYRGDIHYKELPKNVLAYIKYLDTLPQFNLSCIYISSDFGLVGAIDKSKEIRAAYDIWKTGYVNYKLTTGEPININTNKLF